tara:strand:+ start:1576 stop:2514 length:939 start_codon:yes stop_codon:yes gene_type:complete
MATTEQTTITRQAPFLEDYARKLLESSYQKSQDPVNIPDINIAGFTPDQKSAIEKTREGIGAFEPFISSAGDTITDAIGRPSVDETYSAEGIAKFFNPYTQQVVDTTLSDIGRQGQIAQNRLAGQGVGQGAFGGSRSAIAAGGLQRDVLDQQAKSAGQLRAAGFESALQQSRNLADAQIRERSLLGQLAGQQAGLGGLKQQLQQQDVANLLGIGSLQQGQAQALLDAQRQTELQQAYEPYQRLGFFSDILRGVPSSQQTTTSVTAPTPSLLSQIGGVAATGLGLAGQLGYRPFGNDSSGLGNFNFASLGGSK